MVDVGGLVPRSTYHFRVVAENGDGPSQSPDQTFTTFPLDPIFKPCPNEDPFRSQRPSAVLPDCRVFEQASLVNKNGLDATGAYMTVKSSPSGEAVSFVTTSGTPASSGTQEPPLHLSERGAGNWLTRGLLTPQASGQNASAVGWTPDFSDVFVQAVRFGPPNTKALLDLEADGSITEIVPYTAASLNFSFAGESADDSMLFFEAATAPLTPEATPGKYNLYVWERSSEEINLVGFLPDADCAPAPCAPPEGSMAGPYNWINGSDPVEVGGASGRYYTQEQRAVSSDGKSAYFTAGDGQLYRRTNPTEPGAQSVHVSASERTIGGGEDGHDISGTRPAAFMGASADGSVAFLTSPEKLTDDATTGPEPSEPPEIARANIADGSSKQLGFLLADAYGVAVDGEYIYWADPDENAIGRAKLNGEAANEKFIEVPEVEVEAGKFSPAHPQYVTVDSEHIYWTNAADEAPGHGTIGRAAIDGSLASIEEEFIKGATKPRGVAVNGEYVYWANAGDVDETRTIGRAEIDGNLASVEEAFLNVGDKSQERTPEGIAINATHIYMTMNNSVRGLVVRYDLDGDPESRKVFLDDEHKGVAGVRGVAVDGSYVYWARQGKNSIGRIPLDLKEEGATLDFVPAAAGPKGLAIDAQHIFWSANQEVVPNPGNDLYRFVASAPEGERLNDLAVDAGDENGAEVRGVLGISADGSYVYFVANGIPDGVVNTPNGEGESAALGGCEGILSQSGTSTCNLYVWHGGEIGFIARLGDRDNPNWSGTVARVGPKPARISADGRTLLFSSRRKLTAYDNHGQVELYRYIIGETAPSCISCDPTGTPPVSVRAQNVETPVLPTEPPAATLSRNLSEDGKRVFFQTTDALVGADTNGVEGCSTVGSVNQSYPACQDVYEWEAMGSGSCESEAQNGGCLYLISTGKSSEPSLLADASADGDDVLFFTREALVRQDGDQLMDVYDARVGGGLAEQEVVNVTCASEESCKGPPPPQPPFESPATKDFIGPESPSKARPKHCAKGRHRVGGKGKKGRCVPKRHHKGQPKHKRKAHKSRGAAR